MNLPLAALMAAILMPLTEALAVPVFEPVQAFEIAPRDPQGKLVQGADGSFYGTTSDGGASGQGTIYKLSADGTLTTVFHFAGANGSTPKAGLILASDGSFYGTTSKGGDGYGTVFKMTTAGQVATVGTFGGADGSDAQAAVVEGPDGNFYGTTSGGGSLAKGTVFTITPEGTLTTLVSFTGPNGSEPQAELVIGNDGNFYGTTFKGGSESSSGVSGYGTVFRITLIRRGEFVFGRWHSFQDFAGRQLHHVEGPDGVGSSQSGGRNDSGEGWKFLRDRFSRRSQIGRRGIQTHS